MADLAEMIQKLAFYQNGGQDPGTSNADHFNQGFGMVNNIVGSVLAQKKAMLENKKTQAEIPALQAATAKTGAEANKLAIGNTPTSAYMKPVAPAGTAGIGGAPVTAPQAPEYDMSKMTPDQQETMTKSDLQRAQAEYYRSGQKGGDKVYYDTKLRKIVEAPGPNTVRVSSNTGATLGDQPNREAATTGRQIEMERLNVEPSVKLRYNEMRSGLRIATNLEAGLRWAKQNNVDITGILNSPISQFREYMGTLPKEQQEILTNLRRNFAAFGRKMGGTAFTDTEKAIFGPITPQMDLPLETNLNRIGSTIEELNGMLKDEEELTPGLNELFIDGGQHQPAHPQAKKHVTHPQSTAEKKAALKAKLGL